MDSAVSTVVRSHLHGSDLSDTEQFELSNLEQQQESGQQTPVAGTGLSAASSQAALQAALDDGLHVQELAPLDYGVKAWTFCACACVLEMMIWGYCFRYDCEIFFETVYSEQSLTIPCVVSVYSKVHLLYCENL